MTDQPEPMPPGEWSRRDFVKLLGASMALAGLSGCVRAPADEILPYVGTPPDAPPGSARHYATAMTLDGFATGLLVESRDGRPVKIEGNPDHPASRGAAGILEQASLLSLYDPDRAREIRQGKRRSTWGAVRGVFSPAALHRRVGARGAGLRLLLEPTSSPLLAVLLERFRTEYPEAGVYFHASLASNTELTAARAAFGRPLLPQLDLQQAELILSLGADLLATGPYHLRYSRDYAERRRRGGHTSWYVAETAPSPTGTLARQRIAADPLAMPAIAVGILRAVTQASTPTTPVTAPAISPALDAWIVAAAAELVAHRGRSLVVADPRQPVAVHAAVQALNAILGNLGHTVSYAPSPILEAGERSHDLSELSAAIDAHEIDTLVIAAINPCYSSPDAAHWQQQVRAVPNTLYLGEYEDETAAAAGWFAPAANYLESWGDARAYDGTVSPVQPLIDPMFGGHTVAELLALMVGEQATGRNLLSALQPASATDEALRLGVVAGSAFATMAPSAQMQSADKSGDPPSTGAGTVAVIFTPGRAVYDGRFAGNAWLQELPDPVTKLTWDNAALISPMLATRIDAASGDIISLRSGRASIEIPVLIVPGHADGAVSVALGYGRRAGTISLGSIGVDAAALRDRNSPFCVPGVTIARTAGRHALAVTQEHWSIADRKSALFGTGTPPRPPLALYHAPAPAPDGYGADQWAMSIDLDLCTGCSACVVACQAENNIPVVGRDGVLQSREMHWIRIDRYVEGPPATPAFRVQPMLCQHCENAPCEYVCPVDATVHSDDGLNEMVYNRCVGTRFCSNNCPYKVRRFNWFDYNAHVSEFGMMAKNPDVTVRARGVMEKCTFCVQRIRRAQREAELDGRSATGPVMTACQQGCPTQAIVFGSLTDPTSEVRRAFADARSRSALEELGTVPRVRYLAREDDLA